MRTALEKMKHLLGAILILIKGAKIGRDNENAQSESDLWDLDEEDKNIVFSEKFITRAIGDGINPEAIAQFAVHISEENINFTRIIVDIICDGIHSYDSPKFPPYFIVFRAVLSLKDSLQPTRVEYDIGKYIQVINKNMKFKKATHAAIKFLVDFLGKRKKKKFKSPYSSR